MKPLLPLTLTAALLAAPGAFAEDMNETPRIVVTGEGEQAVKPDMALLTLAVTREADTARAALDDNNKAMDDVIAAMKEAGIEDRDLQTSGLSINPRYVYPSDKNDEQTPRIVGYEVTNTLSVRVRELEKVGAVLDRSVTLGVNQGGNIVLTNDDPSEALRAARKDAVEDAMEKARAMADAAGVGTGRILEMREQSATPPPMPFEAKTMRMAAPASDSVPVAAGENTYHVQVSVTFAITQ